MNTTHMLTRHRDIQNWVTDRKGLPAISRVRDDFGGMRARLLIRFGNRPTPGAGASLDDGMSPCSWTAWLAELDRQHLALKISSSDPSGFELVDRKELN
jgi:hypothetical protein